jgi:uncharacterized membrane protein YkgB
MLNRILLAGVLGGLALFLWEGIAHMATPLGEAGIKAVPNEDAFLTTLKASIHEAGFYFFPAPEDRPGMTSAEKDKAMAAAMEKMKTSPTGLLIVHPNGDEGMTATRLAIQCFVDILVMMVAAFVLSQATLITGYLARAGFVTLLALFPVLQVHVPYWNWYGFPVVYTLAQVLVHGVGFFAGGLVLAKVLKASS